jgi:hypothetical protein
MIEILPIWHARPMPHQKEEAKSTNGKRTLQPEPEVGSAPQSINGLNI